MRHVCTVHICTTRHLIVRLGFSLLGFLLLGFGLSGNERGHGCQWISTGSAYDILTKLSKVGG